MTIVFSALMAVLIAMCVAGAFVLATLMVHKYANRPGWVGVMMPAAALLVAIVVAWTSIVGVVYAFTQFAPQIFN